jgi:hypothetical protein
MSRELSAAEVAELELEDERKSLADELIDDLLPPDLDWRRVVRRYPVPSILLVGVGGYLLGRTQGRALLAALSALAASRVEAQVLGLVDDELG